MFPNPTQLAFVTSPENAKIFQDKCEPGNPLITVIFPDTYRYGFFKAQIRLKLSDTLVVKNLNYSPHENSNQFPFSFNFSNLNYFLFQRESSTMHWLFGKHTACSRRTTVFDEWLASEL